MLQLIARELVVLLCGVALVASGCSEGDLGARAPVEQFVGSVDAFYVLPDPLPAGEPGQLIRIQLVSESATSTTLRIMYHSRDTLDRDRAVTGILTYPHAAPPPGGWPVVS